MPRRYYNLISNQKVTPNVLVYTAPPKHVEEGVVADEESEL